MRSSSWTTLRRSSTFSTKYKYESTLDSTHIRLVKIRPRTRSLLSERLNIDVTTHSLDEAEALGYHALSYTWGAPVGEGKRTDSNSCILVNGHRFYVQPNLFSALKRFEEVDWYLWIDAICIDQTNQREREIQVGIMSEIYSMAARVDIWLGDGGKESVEAIRVIRILSSLNEETHGSEVSLDKNAIKSLGLPAMPSLAWRPFVDLLQRNWFRRAWVVQETVLAQQTFVFLGNSESISWEQLASALWMIKRLGWDPNETLAMVNVSQLSWSPGPYAVHYISLVKMSLESLKKPRNQPLIFVMEDLTGPDNWKKTASSHLAYMMMVCHKFKATNARDRVYSLLGMVNIAASHLGIPRCDLEVNYDASVAEVFTAATTNILNHCNHLGYISLAGFAEFHHGAHNLPSDDIPSWVPNFSNEPSAARTVPILFPRGISKDRLDAARYSEIGSLGFSITGSRLSVQAQRVGQILPGLYQFYVLAYHLDVEPFAALLLRCGKRYKGTGELSIEACWRTFNFGANVHGSIIDFSALGGNFKAWLSFILLENLRVWDTSMTVDQRLAILEQLTNFQSLVARDGDEACDMLPSIEWVKQMLQKLGASDPLDSQLASILSFMARTCSLGGFSEEFDLEWTSVVAKELADTFMLAAKYASVLGTYVGQRRVFLTDEGHLGLAFSSALEGDSVWVVSACPVPLVLRPRADGTYQLVGDCYVHGIMEGEAVKDNSWEEITMT
ncbi:heterokaryon incompatibility protein (het-6OR allele) [Fusarium denticulatum]|uniref:Heterokaryon incompatibility protein (Het-6OR allele) n=1 Tax=Fusarium denticulatum TaxID=48507 RepID=A0A8H5XG05_9HYPO|nr:heterokaryon incompatibility protein (het-6OR allele) [Fusarium denticulatum]